MAQLPKKLPIEMMQDRWAGVLNPVLANPLNDVSILKDVVLINGATVINHLLGKTQQGWFLTDVNGAATIYRSAPFNGSTLTLTSNAAVTVSLGVY